VRFRLALAVLVLAGCGGEHASRPLGSGLRAVVDAGVPGGLVLVRDGDHTESAAAGLADVSTHRAVEPGDRFRIGSVTKTFVATVVLQLVAEGKLRLDEPLGRRLPGLLPDGGRITVRDLLAHRSGLVDVADDPTVLAGPRSTWPARRLIALAAKSPRTSAPGAAFRYSSTNYLVLGLLVERVTGRGIAAELERRIIAPLGLHDTSYVPSRIAGTHVHGYSFPSHQGIVDATATPEDLERRSAVWAGAAGDLVSTAPDLARFFSALLGGRLLPAAQLREMETIRNRYGLGLNVFATPCGRAWGHTGNLNGLLTIAWSTRDGRRQLVVAANAYPLPAAADTALRGAATTAFCG
jgi:D-alanyl-D-alanine carboxypeptidase